MENKQTIRQGLNNVEIAGVIKENKLQEGKNESGKYINGSLVIKAGDFTELDVNVFVSEKNKEGKTKKAYTNLKSILDKEHQTMADGLTEEQATKVRIWGTGDFTPRFKEDFYEGKEDNEIKSITKIELGFGNINFDDNLKPEDYKAKFDVEMYVAKVQEEVKKQNGIDTPTGRMEVQGWLPIYGGTVIPLKVVAGIVKDEIGEFNFAEQIKGNIYEGLTINIWGDIDYKEIIEKIEKGGGLGRAKIEEKKTYIHDLVAVGADIIQNPEKMFDNEAVRQAIVERETKKEEAVRKQKEKSKNKNNKGFGIAGNGGKQEVKPNIECPF